MGKGYHLSLTLSGELWSELLAAALPIKVAGEEIHLMNAARRAVASLGVRERVVGLLEDQRTPHAVTRVGDRARRAWRQRRPEVLRRLARLVHVQGEWRVELDNMGTELAYGHQRVAADAYLRGTASGTIYLLRENIEFPFQIERRIGASVALGDIHYDPGHRAVIGSLRDVGVYVGDAAVMQLAARLAEYLLEQQLPRANPVPILRRDQVEDMVGPMGGPLKMQMGVEDLELEITSQEMTLKVRFGFTRAQLTDQGGAEPGPS